MRGARIKARGEGFYHVVSRIVQRCFLLDDKEKGILLGMVRASAEFSGVEVFTYAFMDNHFHLLVRVPGKTDLSFLLLNSGPPEGDYEKRRTSLLSHIHLFLDLLNCFKVGSFLPSLRFNMRRP